MGARSCPRRLQSSRNAARGLWYASECKLSKFLSFWLLPMSLNFRKLRTRTTLIATAQIGDVWSPPQDKVLRLGETRGRHSSSWMRQNGTSNVQMEMTLWRLAKVCLGVAAGRRFVSWKVAFPFWRMLGKLSSYLNP